MANFDLSSLFGFGSLLSTGFQVYSSMQAAKLEEQVFNLKAKQQELQAGQVEVASMEQTNEIRNRLLDNLASSEVSYASSGLSFSSGTPLQAQTESRRRAGLDLQQSISGAKIQALGARGQAAQSRIEGKARRGKGLLAAGMGLHDAITPLSIIGGKF